MGLYVITNITEDKIKNINHNCTTEEGSSGSPIINLQNYGVIGIHRGFLNKINKGILLKIPIEEFNGNIKNEPIDKDRELTDVKEDTLIKTNDSSLNNKGSQLIIKRSFSNQTKPEVGNFYVSKY